jgi:predicted transcriptional regulator
MASTSVRIDQRTHARLRRLSEAEHKSIGQVVTEAVEKYEKDKFWREMHESFARLRADPDGWRVYEEETALWDTTSGDGLENEDELRDEEAAETGNR